MNKMLVSWFCAGFAAVAAARTRESFNDGWEFGFASDDAKRDVARFSPVAVPHDWAIAGPFDPSGDGDTAKLPWKDRIGVYRRNLVIDRKPLGRVFLDIDGAMSRATVRVNGQPCGRSAYAYLGFRADATPYLSAGTNEIEVTCDTRCFRSRWYPGGGLFRNTWIVKTDDVYIQDDSLRIETKRGENGVWSLFVGGTVVSRRAASARVVVTVGGRPVGVEDPAAGSLGKKRCKVTVEGYGTADFSLTMDVKNPREWEMQPDAALYAVKVQVTGDGFDDELTRRIGFRDFRFDPDNGFFLNGRRVQLNGVNLHSDLGPLGMAFDKDAMRRQLEVMRDMGANALRTSHNCPAPEVLDLCDEMGFFVWNECFDKWGPTSGRSDAEAVETFVPPILAAWVRRDRTHPSVFCWSIGNEITPGTAMPPGQENWRSEANHGTSAERCARFRHAVRGEDASRPVCIGSCFPEAGLRGDYAALDLTGWNYREMYMDIHRKYPRQPMLYSESASALSEYGFYADSLPTNKTDYALDRFCVDSHDCNAASWSDIPDREFLRMERDSYCAGEFVWTGIDYLGEPTPYYFWGPVSGKNENCSRSSYFGVCDLCVMPKDRFYLYRSHWNRSEFTLHIVPHHWNFPEKAGRTMPVFVYTSADEAELFVNGVSMGRRRKDRKAGSLDDYYSVLPRYRLVWKEVPYAEGEVKAVAYGEDGSVLGTQVLRTAGEPTGIVLRPERIRGRLCVVEVSLADKDGNFVPDDSRRIGFAAEGCEILAVGNADPRGYESFKDVSGHSLRFGRAAVYVRVGEGVGRLKATAEGLASAEVDIGE